MLCDLESLRGEIQHLKCTFQQNGYSKSNIRWALHPKQKPELMNVKAYRYSSAAVSTSHVQQSQQTCSQIQYQDSSHTKKEKQTYAQDCQGWLGSESPWHVLHSLWVWESICQSDWEIYRGQMQGAYETHMSQSAREICSGRAQYQHSTRLTSTISLCWTGHHNTGTAFLRKQSKLDETIKNSTGMVASHCARSGAQ